MPPTIRSIAKKPFSRLLKLLWLPKNVDWNAGHDLSLENLRYFNQNIPSLLEVSIGHALISDALYIGLELTILKYKECLRRNE